MEVKILEVSGWAPALKGMRNPLESWDKLDSEFDSIEADWEPGDNDKKLAITLTRAGSSHRKFLRFPSIYLDVTAHLKFWDEFATYKFVESNSTSQMHSLGAKPLTIADYDTENMSSDGLKVLGATIGHINKLARERNQYLESLTELKKVVKPTGDAAIANRERIKVLSSAVDILFNEMVKLNAQGYLYTRTVKLNYETLIKMYANRVTHKLKDWRDFCVVIRENIPFLNAILISLEEKHGRNYGV